MRGQVGLVFIVMCSALHLWPRSAEAVILINEVLADPPTVHGDANRDGASNTTQDEFVELVNTAADSVGLANWRLADAVKVRHVFSSGDAIPSRGFFVVFGGGAPQGFPHADVASSGTLSLNNAGDTLTLRDASGTLIDTFTYGTEGGHDTSLTRSPDAVGPFTLHVALNGVLFSPGTASDGSLNLPNPPHADAPTAPFNPDPRDPLDPPRSPIIPEPHACFLFGQGVLTLIAIRRRCS